MYFVFMSCAFQLGRLSRSLCTTLAFACCFFLSFCVRVVFLLTCVSRRVRVFIFPLPQLYVKGELIGGLDIVKEMVESGDFADAVKV